MKQVLRTAILFVILLFCFSSCDPVDFFSDLFRNEDANLKLGDDNYISDHVRTIVMGDGNYSNNDGNLFLNCRRSRILNTRDRNKYMDLTFHIHHQYDEWDFVLPGTTLPIKGLSTDNTNLFPYAELGIDITNLGISYEADNGRKKYAKEHYSVKEGTCTVIHITYPDRGLEPDICVNYNAVLIDESQREWSFSGMVWFYYVYPRDNTQ